MRTVICDDKICLTYQEKKILKSLIAALSMTSLTFIIFNIYVAAVSNLKRSTCIAPTNYTHKRQLITE